MSRIRRLAAQIEGTLQRERHSLRIDLLKTRTAREAPRVVASD